MKGNLSFFRSVRRIAIATALALASLAATHAQTPGRTGQSQIDRAVRDLRDAGPSVRLDAVLSLAKLAPKQHAADFARMLSDDSPWVVDVAVKALADIGAKQYAGNIAGVLKTDNFWAKRDAMAALSELGAAEHAKDIVPFLRSRNRDLRLSAIHALRQLGAKQYAPDVVRLLKDEDYWVRCVALSAVGDMGTSRDAADVAGFLTDSDSVIRRSAAQALAKLEARDYGPAIAKLLLDEDVLVREDATHALLRMGYVPLVSDVFKIASDAVVLIETQQGGRTFTGTGFSVTGGGRILTNQHVIDPMDHGDFRRITVRFRDGRTFGVDRLWMHPSYDLALLQLQDPPKGMPYLSFDDSLPPVGDELIVIGHPGGLGWSLSEGRLSQFRDDPGGGKNVWIQTDGAMNPGNSGGPMLNRYAQIVGIATKGVKKFGNDHVSGLNFGISAPVARDFVFGQLPAGRLPSLADRKLDAP